MVGELRPGAALRVGVGEHEANARRPGLEKPFWFGPLNLSVSRFIVSHIFF